MKKTKNNFTINGLNIDAYRLKQADESYAVVLVINGKRIPIEFKRSKLTADAEKLLDFVPEIRREDIVEICRQIETKMSDFPIVPCFSGCGWQYDKNGGFIGYLGTTAYDTKGKKVPIIEPVAKKKGKYKADVLSNWLKGGVKRQIIFCTALAAPICGLVKHNIILGVVGESSTGKTTAAKTSLSMFSSPNDEKIALTFNDTISYRLKSMGGINVTPVLIDDTSLYEEDDLHKFIYRLAAGEERGRLGKNYEKVDGKAWYTSTILTAERPILFDETVAKKLEGVVGRLIEINVSGNDLFDSAKQAEAIEKLANSNYGVIEEKYIKKFFDKGIENMKKLWGKKTENIRKTVGSTVGSEDKIVMRLCKSIATIVLAGELANEYLGLSMDTEVMAKELIEVCISNVTDFREFAKTGNSADKLIEKFSGKINDLVGDNLEDVKELKMTADEFNSILKGCGMHETTLWKQSLIEKGYIERNHTNSGQVYHIKLEALNHD